MRTLFVLVTVAALCWAAAPVDATCYSARRVQVGYNYGYNYGHGYAVQRVYVAAYQPYYLPYAVGYGASHGTPDLEKEVLKLKLEVKNLELQQLRQQIQQQPQQQQGQPQEQPLPLKTSMVAQRCASCHDEGRAKASGGGLVLLKGGGIGHLSAETRLKCVAQILSGKMPKGGKISNEDASQAIAELTGGQP